MKLAALLILFPLGILVAAWVIKQRENRATAQAQSGAQFPPQYSFREIVRDPSARDMMEFDRGLEQSMIQVLADGPTVRLIDNLVQESTYKTAQRAIRIAGSRVVPDLMKALEDPRFRVKIEHKPGEYPERVEPVETVIECLGEIGARRAIQKLSRFVEDDSERVRKATALALGSMGDESALPAITRCFADDEDYVRSYALSGVQHALRSNSAAPEFRAAIFEPICALVEWEGAGARNGAPEVLIELDRDRAISFLSDPVRLRPDSPGLKDTLRALRRANATVDEVALLGIVETYESRKERYPGAQILGECLPLLAQSGSSRAREVIHRGFASHDAKVRRGAGEALAALEGVNEPFRYAWEREESVGWEGLEPTQRWVLSVRILIDEVNNGGFSQYFWNSSADTWKHASNGLHAIGAHETLRLLIQATSFFGQDGPSTDRDVRTEQLAKLVNDKDDDNLFGGLETEFYEDRDDREALLLKFVAEHAQDFRD